MIKQLKLEPILAYALNSVINGFCSGKTLSLKYIFFNLKTLLEFSIDLYPNTV